MVIDKDVSSEFLAGTGIALQAAAAIGFSKPLQRGVTIKSEVTNVAIGGIIYICHSAINGGGYSLSAGESVTIPIDDLAKVFVSSTATPESSVQEIELESAIAGDMFRLSYDDESTDWLLVGSDASAVQTALEALTGIGAGNITVTGTSLLEGPLTLTFGGDLENTAVETVEGEGGTYEQQTVAIDDASNGGHFHLTFGEETTGEIAYNADAAAVKAALELLSTIGEGNVDVSGGPGPTGDWLVTFKADLGAQDVALLVGDGTALTGGSTDVTVTETTPGAAKTFTNTDSTPASDPVRYSWFAC